MPAISREGDDILSPTGSGYKCNSPLQVNVYEVNGNSVYVNGLLVVNEGCLIEPHPVGGCGPDTSVLDDCSTTVFIGGKGVGRIGDKYGDNVIIQGSPNVFVG